MRVANIIEEGKLGGPQVRMVRVAAAMEDVETLIVMPTANSGPFRALCEEAGVRYRALPLTRITKEWREALKYLLLSPLEVLRLARLFRREGVDLVHASGGSWQYKGVIAARLAGIPSVWHLNDTQMPGWVRRLFRLFSPLPAGFIFASERSREYYGALLADRVQAVVPSTVDARHFDPEVRFPGEDGILAGQPSGPVIGTVANVTPIKGLETLIHASALLRAELPDLRVVIVGAIHQNREPYFARLKALAEDLGVADHIEWAGAQSDVRPYLARFDVYVCSSHAESSPVSVWEAMAMARPVVSTDVGDVARHIVNGKSGCVVPVGNVAAMADQIAGLLRDRQLRDRMGQAARKAVAAFSPDGIAAKTSELYQRVLDASVDVRARDTNEVKDI